MTPLFAAAGCSFVWLSLEPNEEEDGIINNLLGTGPSKGREEMEQTLEERRLRH